MTNINLTAQCECDHEYGEHYETFGGDQGCRVEEGGYDDSYPCQCAGFELRISWEPMPDYDVIGYAVLWAKATEEAMAFNSVLSQLVDRSFEDEMKAVGDIVRIKDLE